MPNFKSAMFDSSKENEHKITMQLGNNPMQCDCRFIEFIRLIKGKFSKYINFLIDDLYCKGPEDMLNKSVKNLDLKDIKCEWLRTNTPDACNNICTCWNFPETQKIYANCSHQNLDYIPNLVGKYNEWTIDLDLSSNQIKSLPSLTNDAFKNIKILDLSNNSISSITTDLFSKSLRTLKLNDNKISKLDYSVMQHLEKSDISLTNLSLHDNPWECDCNTEKLTKISSINNSYSREKIHCKNYNEFLFKVNFSNLCRDKNVYFQYVIFVLIVLLSFIAMVIIFYYYYQEKNKLLLLNNFWCYLQSDIIANKSKNELYDAFYSFVNGDTDFNHNELVTKLENKKYQEQEPKIPYKLFLNTRDWPPGE